MNKIILLIGAIFLIALALITQQMNLQGHDSFAAGAIILFFIGLATPTKP
jgi:hypothetical protein